MEACSIIWEAVGAATLKALLPYYLVLLLDSLSKRLFDERRSLDVEYGDNNAIYFRHAYNDYKCF